MAATALKKINARAKALKKEHPGKKYKTLQKQAGAEYRAGKLKAKRKPAARKKTAKRRTIRKVGKAQSVVYSLGKLVKRKRRKSSRPKLVTRTLVKYQVFRPKNKKGKNKARITVKRNRSVTGKGSSMMPVLLIGGLGILAYMLLKPATPPAYMPTTNLNRNNSANNLIAYATAAGLGISAITNLINALNNMSDNDVINANNNPASAVAQLAGPTSTVQAPGGGPTQYF